MTYVAGSASSFADLKTAVENHAVSNGWSLTSTILSKNGVFIKVESGATGIYIRCGTGQTGSTITGTPNSQNPSLWNADQVPCMWSASSDPIVFPIAYEIHAFSDPDEVYVVIQFNGGFYSHFAFGKSSVAGIGGTGAWVTGSYLAQAVARPAQYRVRITSNADWWCFSSIAGEGGATGMFAEGLTGTSPRSYIHAGLDGSVSWASPSDVVRVGTGLKTSPYCAGLITKLPNLMNQATVLIPVKAFLFRSDRRITTVLDLRNARYLRTDNVEDGSIVQYGGDYWKVYPFLRREVSARNCEPIGSLNPHSGTFGFAIRYEGP